jgi:hypothetical protein
MTEIDAYREFVTKAHSDETQLWRDLGRALAQGGRLPGRRAALEAARAEAREGMARLIEVLKQLG